MPLLGNNMHTNFDMKNIMEDLLNIYWLRPETALWRTIDMFILENVILSGRSLDFGCGDGIFSFLRAGGKLENSFDVFYGVDEIQNFYKNVDIYNFAKTNHIMIKNNASYKISVGFDLKQSLLKKANKLDFYEELLQGDGNNKLPFKDNEFDSIFSNVLYWLDDIDSVLAELHRILKPGGNLYILVPDVNFLNASFYHSLQQKEKTQGYEFLSYLDRGRVLSNIKHIKCEDDWRFALNNIGFKIFNHKKYLSSRFLKIWDIGFRPIFPALHNASSRMNIEDRLNFKNDLTDILKIYMKPLLDLEFQDTDSDKGFHFFHLKK